MPERDQTGEDGSDRPGAGADAENSKETPSGSAGDLTDEEVVFLSPEPTPRPFPHSNRRSERVARQRKERADREEEQESPFREPLRRSSKKTVSYTHLTLPTIYSV